MTYFVLGELARQKFRGEYPNKQHRKHKKHKYRILSSPPSNPNAVTATFLLKIEDVGIVRCILTGNIEDILSRTNTFAFGEENLLRVLLATQEKIENLTSPRGTIGANEENTGSATAVSATEPLKIENLTGATGQKGMAEESLGSASKQSIENIENLIAARKQAGSTEESLTGTSKQSSENIEDIAGLSSQRTIAEENLTSISGQKGMGEEATGSTTAVSATEPLKIENLGSTRRQAAEGIENLLSSRGTLIVGIEDLAGLSALRALAEESAGGISSQTRENIENLLTLSKANSEAIENQLGVRATRVVNIENLLGISSAKLVLIENEGAAIFSVSAMLAIKIENLFGASNLGSKENIESATRLAGTTLVTGIEDVKSLLKTSSCSIEGLAGILSLKNTNIESLLRFNNAAMLYIEDTLSVRKTNSEALENTLGVRGLKALGLESLAVYISSRSIPFEIRSLYSAVSQVFLTEIEWTRAVEELVGNDNVKWVLGTNETNAKLDTVITEWVLGDKSAKSKLNSMSSIWILGSNNETIVLKRK